MVPLIGNLALLGQAPTYLCIDIKMIKSFQKATYFFNIHMFQDSGALTMFFHVNIDAKMWICYRYLCYSILITIAIK